MSLLVENVNSKTVAAIVGENLSLEARLMTDEAQWYIRAGKTLDGGHRAVNHRKGEYVNRFERDVHTNTIEGFFSIFKRGMRGVYQHCGKQHLHRYLAEFDFRYSNRIANGCDDTQRAAKALSMIGGKRLTYRRTDGLQAA